MRFADTTTNLLTGILAAGVAFYLMGVHNALIDAEQQDENHQETQVHVPDYIRISFGVIVAIMAMTNITGVPQRLVNEHWQDTMFGEKFLPTHSLTVKEKRMVAGLIELTGLLLSLNENTPTNRAIGYGVIFVMYARGTMINSRISLSKTLFTLVVSSAAAFLLSAEIENDFVLAMVKPTSDIGDHQATE